MQPGIPKTSPRRRRRRCYPAAHNRSLQTRSDSNQLHIVSSKVLEINLSARVLVHSSCMLVCVLRGSCDPSVCGKLVRKPGRMASLDNDQKTVHDHMVGQMSFNEKAITIQLLSYFRGISHQGGSAESNAHGLIVQCLIRVPNMNYYPCYSIGWLLSRQAKIYKNILTLSDRDIGQK